MPKFIFAVLVLVFPARALSQPNPPEAIVSIVQARGEIGKELTVKPFEIAISQAEHHDVDLLVFIWNCPGGHIADARLIAEALSQAPDTVRVISVVKKARNAALFALAASDEIIILPNSGSGAVISFEPGMRPDVTGFSSLDSSSIATEIAAIASTNHQPGELYRAIVLSSEELFVTKTDDGSVYMSNSHAGEGELILSNSIEDDLALTPGDAIKIGFASPSQGVSATAIAEALGHGLASVSRSPGTKFALESKKISRTVVSLVRLDKNIEAAAKQAERAYQSCLSAKKTIDNSDPRKLSLYYYVYSGKLTPESQIKWMNQIRIYQDKLYALQREIKRAADAEKKAVSASKKRNNAVEQTARLTRTSYRDDVPVWEYEADAKSELESIWTWSVSELQWTEENRTRYKVDG